MRSLHTPILSFLLMATFAVAQTSAPAAKSAKAADQPSASSSSLPSESTVDSFLRENYGWMKDVSWKIDGIRPASSGLVEFMVVFAAPQGQQLVHFYITPDGQHAFQGDLIPFGARPFDPIEKTLEKGINGPSRGPKDSPVTIVEFGDLQCPACKAAQPAIEGLAASAPNARFVFQNFPLEMHNWAAKGAAYADCVGRASNEAFWKFVAKTYDTQADITAENADEKLTALADGVGLKGAEIAACAATPATKARVDASLALGKTLEVTGTPTVFINGRKIGNIGQVPTDVLKDLVEFAAKDGQ
ncbi:MAG: thioredoxin domain-containing protein [Candidatus Sulfotelmatobacter sp.]